MDSTGKIIAEASCAHDPVYPNPAWAEQVVADWIHSFKSVVHQLLAGSGVAPEEIGTIGMDAINDSVVAVDKDGKPLMNSIIWLDRRAEAEIREIAARISHERVFEVTGLNLDSSHTAAKMLWIKKNRPDVFAQCKSILNVDSFMVHWMTGESVVDYAQASASMLYNVTKKQWDDEMAEMLLDSGVDFISVDVDGFSKEVYEKIRKGADRDVVYNNVLNFVEKWKK